MIDIDEIRRSNLRRLESELSGPAQTAAAIGMSTAQFINLRDGAKDSKTGKPRGMRKETARRIERAAGKPEGWLDIPPDTSAPSPDRPAAAPTAAEPAEPATLPSALSELLAAARPLSDADLKLLAQMARRLRPAGAMPPVESSAFLPEVPAAHTKPA